MIIGAAKSGTTSLHNYLDLHPQVFMSKPKELRFFNRDDWGDSVDWYRAQFPTDLPVRGESSPVYSMHPWFPSVPERMRDLIPGARLIYLVRDPIERLLAHYVEFYANRLEDRPLSEALADYDSSSNRIVTPSRYAYQLDRFRAVFPDSQIHVLDQHELLTARRETLREVFAFLNVDPDFSDPAFDRMYNERQTKMRANRLGLGLQARGVLMPARRGTRVLPDAVRERLKLLVADPVPTPSLDSALRAELTAFLHDDAERLRAYTGKAFAQWPV